MDQQQDAAVVRQQDFECDGPIGVVVELGAGKLDVHLVEGGRTVAVQVRPDSTEASPWTAGIAGLLSWLGEQAGSGAPGELGTEAVRRTRIEFEGERLVVQTPKDLPLRTVPLVVTVTAPAGSTLTARSGSADVTVDGVSGRLELATGSGDVRAQRCEGPAEVRTGSGDVRIGSVVGALRVRTGSGVVEVISLEGTGTVQTGSGDVRLGAVSDDLSARTGSGDLTIADAAGGRLELSTGSGQLRVGIHSG
ncbi:MAG: DUF4097 family beta strand repeat-containing protein, partial [Pseudonocardiaceae bacterium]